MLIWSHIIINMACTILLSYICTYIDIHFNIRTFHLCIDFFSSSDHGHHLPAQRVLISLRGDPAGGWHSLCEFETWRCFPHARLAASWAKQNTPGVWAVPSVFSPLEGGNFHSLQSASLLTNHLIPWATTTRTIVSHCKSLPIKHRLYSTEVTTHYSTTTVNIIWPSSTMIYSIALWQTNLELENPPWNSWFYLEKTSVIFSATRFPGGNHSHY